VRIWQDLEAIAYGTTWLTEIEQAIAETSFFIPIVTRAFLESKMCCQEVMLFHRRQLALGRNDLIFPFHFMDVTRVQADECNDPVVLPLLQERQAFNFSRLRLRDPHSEEVATTLANLAAAIDDALRRTGIAERRTTVVVAAQPSAPQSTAPLPVDWRPPLVRQPPSKPTWTSAVGTDRFGTFADIDFNAGRSKVVSQRLRLIPPGKFEMGSPDGEPGRFPYEGPRHVVNIDQAFWLFDTPCTQALWEAVMGDNPSLFKSATRPVERVSVEDVQCFLTRVNSHAPGLHLSLPSEACWEYACRAGTETATYAGPTDILGVHNAPMLDKIAWYGGNSGVGFELNDWYDSSSWPEKQHSHTKAGTHPVQTRDPNAWGLHDMLGNVWEWCDDHWHDNNKNAPADGTAWLCGSAEKRVIRGGSWLNEARYVRAACRVGFDPSDRTDGVGFRCARGHR
jgi:formylglycine-generating enzyme required for sulfatase activity